MGILDALRSGIHGVTLTMPEDLVVEKDGDDQASLIDADRGVGWYLFTYPGLHLDLAEAHEALLRRDVTHQAKWLFDSMREGRAEEGQKVAPTNESKSPFLSLERVTLGGAPAIVTLHRMAYEPMLEIVMGHLMVPLRRGLFEARWIAASRTTGIRESMLLEQAMAAKLGRSSEPASGGVETDDVMELMHSIDSDDPSHDAAFPNHPLSVARAAARWIREESGIVIGEPASAQPGGEIVFDEIGCAFAPPPRFVAVPPGPEKLAKLHRVSIAGTDGVDWLFVDRVAPRGRGIDDTVMLAARETYRDAGVEDVRVHRGDGDGVVVAEGKGNAGRLRMVTRGFTDATGQIVVARIATTAGPPAADLVAELEAIEATFRLLPREAVVEALVS